MYFVEVVGPLDAVYVGPFDVFDHAEAHAYAISERNPIFQTCVFDKVGMDKQIAEYGNIPLQAPECWE